MIATEPRPGATRPRLPLDARWYQLRPDVPAPAEQRFGAAGPALARFTSAVMAAADPAPELVAGLALGGVDPPALGVLTVATVPAAGYGMGGVPDAATMVARLSPLFSPPIPGWRELAAVSLPDGTPSVRTRRPETAGGVVVETLRYLCLSPDGRTLAVGSFLFSDVRAREQLVAAADSVLGGMRWT
ncbi:MAG: hypothetical protein ACJ73S_29045 [Mycobacteriales bacterium]